MSLNVHAPISGTAPIARRIPGLHVIHFRPDDGGGGTSSSAAATGSQTAGAGGSDSKPDVSFDAAQQAKVQELIDATYAKAAAKTEAKVKGELEKLQAELEKLKGGENGGEKPGDKTKDADKGGEKTYTKEQLDRLLADADERHSAKLKVEAEKVTVAEERALKLLEKDRTAAIVSAAAKAQAIDPEEVAALTLRHVAHDDEGNITVLNEKGGARLGPKGDPLTVEEFIRDWIEKRPHHKRGSGTGGAGSGTDGKPGQADLAKLTPVERIARGLKMRKG